jgi:hypothetical protein
MNPEGAENLCDLQVFAEESSRAVLSVDTEGVKVNHGVRQRPERRGLAVVCRVDHTGVSGSKPWLLRLPGVGTAWLFTERI